MLGKPNKILGETLQWTTCSTPSGGGGGGGGGRCRNTGTASCFMLQESVEALDGGMPVAYVHLYLIYPVLNSCHVTS